MWIPRLFRTTGLSIGLNGGREKKNWNINPFNKLIIDEIYRTFTVRVGGANVLLLSRRNPGNISGLAPLRLDLRARTNEPGSELNAKRWCISVHQLSIGRQCSGRTMRHDQRYRRKFIPRPSTFRPSKIPTIHSRIINNVLASAKYDQRHSIRSSYTRLSLKCDSSHVTFLRCCNIGANECSRNTTFSMDAPRRDKSQSKRWIRQYAKRLENSKRAGIAGPRGLIGPYLAVIKAPAAAISDRENEQHCSPGETRPVLIDAYWHISNSPTTNRNFYTKPRCQ